MLQTPCLECAEWYLVNYDLPLKKIKLTTERTEGKPEEEIETNILQGSIQNTTSGSSRKIKNYVIKILKN